MDIMLGCIGGFIAWFVIRYFIAGFYIIDQNQRAVITTFGRADRLGMPPHLNCRFQTCWQTTKRSDMPIRRCGSSSQDSTGNGHGRRVHRVSIATATMNMA